MRCEIAATFLHNPKIVYLDEPTIGLDVLVKENIRKFIKDINKEKNTTVILTTHDLKDIEDVCDRIILLDKGQIIFDGEKQKFKDTYGNSVSAEIILKNKKTSITEKLYDEDFEIVEENEKNIKIKFDHNRMTIVKIVEMISKYGDIVDIHMIGSHMNEYSEWGALVLPKMLEVIIINYADSMYAYFEPAHDIIKNAKKGELYKVGNAPRPYYKSLNEYYNK